MEKTIAIYVDHGGFDGVEVYPGPEGDGIAQGGTFKTKREAETFAEKEVKRLQKMGYQAEWACNY